MKGQMPLEECLTDTGNSGNNYTTRYVSGARGMDRIETTTNSGSTVGYPVYDAHGNMLTSLAKSGSGYTYATCRLYDAWGGIRSGSGTGSPSGRHCANLGHVQDDESGFVYMRARFYEPGAGRFVNEDPGLNGRNWFTYCDNDPVNLTDASGKIAVLAWLGMAFFMGLIGGFVAILAQMAQDMCSGVETTEDKVAGAFVRGFITAAAAFMVGTMLACGGVLATLTETQLGNSVAGALILAIVQQIAAAVAGWVMGQVKKMRLNGVSGPTKVVGLCDMYMALLAMEMAMADQ